jgi:hypothetical protein
MPPLARPVVLLALSGLLTVPVAAQTSLTIYNDGRVLTRRSFPVAVPAGSSVHRLALGLLDPGSIFTLDSTVSITGAQFDAAVDDQNTMRRAVGRRLLFRLAPPRDTVSALVLGVDPERFQLADGTVSFGRPGQAMYPADLVLLAPTLNLALRSAAARPSLRLGWFTEGASWQANYQVMLAGTAARVAAHAAIQGGAMTVDSAEIQLLAGSVGRAGGASQAMFRAREIAMAPAPQMAMDAASSERVGEVYLYTVPGRLSLRPGIMTTAALFDPTSTGVERTFTVPGSMPYWGPMPQQGDDSEVPVAVTYVLRRAPRTAFGDLPIPGGTVRIYQPDDAGRPQLIGEASVGHTAPGQDLRVNAGTAFDLTARRVQTSYASRRDSTRTIATAAYRVTVANARDSVVTVDVLEERGGEWRVLQSSVTADRLSSTRTRFRVRVPARGEAVLTYRIEARW